MHELQNLKPLLDKVDAYLPSLLVDEASKSKINRLHEYLPMLNMANIEIRLQDGDQRVDANFLVWKYEAPVLFKWLKKKKQPFYLALRKWVKDWMDPRKAYNQLIQNIWIMYDLDKEDEKIPEPWVIFSFSEIMVDPESHQFIIRKIAEYFDHRYTDQHWNVLKRIYDELPTGAVIPAIGFQNRNINSIRLGVKKFFNTGQMESYLKAIRWPGDFRFIEKHYQEFVPLADHSMLSITFNEEVITDLGVECYFKEENNLKESRALLEKLCEHGLCSKAKKEAIQDWIGEDYTAGDFWTLNPDYYDPTQDDVFIQRWLIEVKMVYKKNQAPSAKAYFLYHQKSSKLA